MSFHFHRFDDFVHSFDLSLFPNLWSANIRGSAAIIEDLVKRVSSTALERLTLRMVAHESSTDLDDAVSFIAVIDFSSKLWGNSLAHVSLHASGFSAPLPLRRKTVKSLVHLPEVQHLEISGWRVGLCIVDDLCSQARTEPSKLQTLLLPKESPVLFSRLKSIVDACPLLVSLRCRIEVTSLDLTNPIDPSSLTPHNLEFLCVGDAEPMLDSNDLLRVAIYLDSLFPCLKSIEKFNRDLQSFSQWAYIQRLITMLQTARLVERNRLLGNLGL